MGGDGMSDDGPWAAQADDETTGERPRRRWVLPVLVVALVLVLLAAAWVVAARRGVQQFDDALGEAPTGSCDGQYSAADVRPEFLVPSALPEDLEPVAEAFTAFFAQERWSYTDVSQPADAAEPDSEIRFSVDGDVFERREPDGFVGRIRPGAGIARFEGDRFWVATCVNSLNGWQVLDDAGCIETDVDGARTQVRWANVRDHTCEDAIASMSATLEDGRLVEWTIEVEDLFVRTATAEEPVSLDWPSPLWIVPGWLAGGG